MGEGGAGKNGLKTSIARRNGTFCTLLYHCLHGHRSIPTRRPVRTWEVLGHTKHDSNDAKSTAF